jgi:serine/threonine-protein kinase
MTSRKPPGGRAFFLELVEGETLAERIKRGPLPIEEALGIAKQICEALEAAHSKAWADCAA